MIVRSCVVRCGLVVAVAGCGKVVSTQPDAQRDAAIDAIDAPPERGSEQNPALSCEELRGLAKPSGMYWLRAAETDPAFPAYCEQELEGGGWAMVLNSVRRADGTTTAFWQIPYAERLARKGAPSPTENYYDGSLYTLGTAYFDAIVDVQSTLAVAASVTALGFDTTTMTFVEPTLTAGNNAIFNSHYASGWSSADHDNDPAAENCAAVYSNVTQHYGGCWSYNLGSDADEPKLDGGVGPHVYMLELSALGLAQQPDGGSYSQVLRIARFTRW